MKRQLVVLLFTTLLFACSKRSDDNSTKDDTLSADNDSTATSITTDHDELYLTSTYDDAMHSSETHKASLRELYDSGVFSTIHAKVLSTLPKKHQEYFISKPELQLLSTTSGNLFQNGNEDRAFTVYDTINSRVSIVVYNKSTNSYLNLFRDVKVKNALETVDCKYASFGTLDYQVAGELLYQRDYLIKKPERYLEYSKCKITDIAKDEDLVLDQGCFAQNYAPTTQSTSLCISTDAVYNNWECLTYDKSKNIFIIFYGQAFAD